MNIHVFLLMIIPDHQSKFKTNIVIISQK